MAEFASAIVGPVVESLMVPVKKHMGYLLLSTDRVRNMKARMTQLEGTFDDVKNHKDTNDRSTLEVPARVPGWLGEVTKIKTDAETISSNESGCFNIKARYQMGRNAWKTSQEIERLHQEGLAFSWTDAQKPLGRVYTRRASTSAPSGAANIGEDFKSRDTTFNDALKLLQQDQKTQVIALCGMGGVGKTTMMEQLKKTVNDKKMFDCIVKVVIGKQPNWHSIQNAVAEYLGRSLTEETETTRADRLHKRFEETLKKSEKGILVILDDVWEKVELKNIGLSPLPNRVKLLLTSRYENICKTIAVHEDNLDLKVLKVNVLEQREAHKFFCQITNISEESDRELYQIGGEIVKKCSCLPLAIKLIAPTLISEEKSIWKDSLRRLRNNDLDQNVHEIIKISYDYLKGEEDREIFLLCGLFREDSNIPIEDLTRYAWGLELLNGVSTLEDGRNRIKACVRNLKNANLLIDGDYPWCVKMHDLVLAFVLAAISKGDHASIINHGDMSKWSSEDMSESCKRISLVCEGMHELPIGIKCPNLSLLKLMDGDFSLEFPQGFFESTGKLKVIAYQKMKLHPRSLQCSTNLRTLCLHECELMFDLPIIGDLSNLEVLSLTYCCIINLPSKFGNLEKLKVLDLTGCRGDVLIDDGFLKSLVKLEEFYMISYYAHARVNVDEFVGCSKNLTALAFEFNALPKNLSFKKLERFQISLGGDYFEETNDQSRHSFENTLRLVTDKRELLDSGMNQLFDKTEVLHLQVNGVNDLEDGLQVDGVNHHHRSSFNYLRVLHICKCADLRYLFTVAVANGLTKLERLTISECPVLEEVVNGNKGGVGVIKFQALKFLSLYQLPKLKGLCNSVDVIELPQLMELQLDGLPKLTSIYPLATSSMSVTISERQSFLKEEVVIPKLEKLHIRNMENLKEIWPCEFTSSEEVKVCILREILIKGCDSVVNLFPGNPMSLLHHLEELIVEECSSIEVLFNIDLESVEESSCCLRSIRVWELENLREVWRLKGANGSRLTFNGFQAVESLEISGCKRFRNIFTPTTTNFDMRALTKVIISDCGESETDDDDNSSQDEEIEVMSNEEISQVNNNTISNVVFSSGLIHTLHNLHNLSIENYKGAGVVFEIESPTASSKELATTPPPPPQSNQQLLPYLKDLRLSDMKHMSHVWKCCNWNKFLIPPQKQGSSSSSLYNLTDISLERCKNIKYLFSPLMAQLLSNLKTIKIKECDVIEEVVSNRDDEDEEGIGASTNTSSNGFFPLLDILNLDELPNLKRIGGGGGPSNTATSTSFHDFKLPHVNDVAWSLCQYSRKIKINGCRALRYVIPSYALGQMRNLEELKIEWCESLEEVCETQGFNVDEGSGGNDACTLVIPSMKKINVPQLSNLKDLLINGCDLLQHVFTFSTHESLTQLERLSISNCKAMKVIVKKLGNEEQTTISSKVVLFPLLKAIALANLPNLTGFFLGKNESWWPLLDDVEIDGCPQMMVFTSGCSITPKLNYIHTGLGKHCLESSFSSLDTTNSCDTTSKGTPWLSFHNLIEMDGCQNHDVKKIIPANELRQLQKLEKIHVESYELVEEVFEVLEGKHSSELQSVVEIPKLREMELKWLKKLNYLWKNNPWMVIEFPNLTKLSMYVCTNLEHVFSSSMVGSLLQLQDLHIAHCDNIEVIIKEEEEEECDAKLVNEIIMLPRLKSLRLVDLSSLEGFYLGKEAFSLPSLTSLEIDDCPEIRVFTNGDLATPELKVIETSYGSSELAKEEDLNSFINTKRKEGLFSFAEIHYGY